MNEKKSVVTFKNGKKMSISKAELETLLLAVQDNEIDLQIFLGEDGEKIFAIRFSEVICIE
jgi:uncharacterized protein (UPF0216 family)